jgi:hypothetical protein
MATVAAPVSSDGRLALPTAETDRRARRPPSRCPYVPLWGLCPREDVNLSDAGGDEYHHAAGWGERLKIPGTQAFAYTDSPTSISTEFREQRPLSKSRDSRLPRFEKTGHSEPLRGALGLAIWMRPGYLKRPARTAKRLADVVSSKQWPSAPREFKPAQPEGQSRACVGIKRSQKMPPVTRVRDGIFFGTPR